MWWVLLALVATVATGCASDDDRPAAVAASPTGPSPTERFIAEARGTALGQGTDAEVLALGTRACGVLDNPGMTPDSAGKIFALTMNVPAESSAAFFRAAATYLCPDQS